MESAPKDCFRFVARITPQTRCECFHRKRKAKTKDTFQYLTRSQSSLGAKKGRRLADPTSKIAEQTMANMEKSHCEYTVHLMTLTQMVNCHRSCHSCESNIRNAFFSRSSSTLQNKPPRNDIQQVPYQNFLQSYSRVSLLLLLLLLLVLI